MTDLAGTRRRTTTAPGIGLLLTSLFDADLRVQLRNGRALVVSLFLPIVLMYALGAGKRFGQLSGGQQKRLALLIATVHDPSLVLLDEPTAGLDPQSRRQLWERIEHLRHSGRSVLLTTHSMEEAQSVCDRVAIIDHGKIVSLDTPAGLIAKHRDDSQVKRVARGEVTLEDVFIGLTGSEPRD